MTISRSYPAQAYVSGLQLWWELRVWPGGQKRFGDEPRIAAWLAFNKAPGDTFTTEELRRALGDQLSTSSRNDREHFQRRIRELRSPRDGWIFPSAKHDRGLDLGDYKLERIGWHPALGPRPHDTTKVSTKTRRDVFARDHNRCFHCGVISGEPYVDMPNRTAVLTVGHIVPRERGGSGDASNLRTECAACNESARSDTAAPESLGALLASIDNLRSADRTKLLRWITAGQRIRDGVDAAYDRYRLLSNDDKAQLLTRLEATTKA
ncbi:HNH endonuclease [Microbacterium sp. LBN7]|uniref:HNH endonuclease n=1 Tax=Microbacterium sp. LBN7 TaxID=3129773 RepID=UPI00388F4581